MLRTADKRIFLAKPLMSIVAGPTPLPPRSVRDFSLWLDFADLTKLGLNSAGSQIGAVLSKVGPYAGTATPFSFGARRLGRYGVPDFGGSDSITLNYTVGTRPHSAMAVIVADTFSAENKWVYSAAGGNNRIGLFIEQTSGLVKVNLRDVAVISSGLAISAGTATVVGHALSTSGARFQVGASQATASDSNTATAGTITFPFFGGGGQNLDGTVGELMIWDRELSSGEMTDVKDYLTLKWGL